MRHEKWVHHIEKPSHNHRRDLDSSSDILLGPFKRRIEENLDAEDVWKETNILEWDVSCYSSWLYWWQVHDFFHHGEIPIAASLSSYL